MGDFIVIVVFLAIFVGIPYVMDKIDAYKKEFEKRERDIKNEFNKREQDIQKQNEKNLKDIVDKVELYKKNLEQKENEMKNEFEKRERNISRQIQRNIEIKNDLENIRNNKEQDCPWLAERIADYYEMLDTTTEKYLRTKKNPALKASEVVAEIKKEKRELIKAKKKLEYQLTFLKNNFPMLEDAMQLNSDELTEAINSIYNLTL